MEELKHILVATDGSAQSSRAFRVALRMATSSNSQLTLVHVSEMERGGGRIEDVERLRDGLGGRVDEFENQARQAGLRRVSSHVVSGLAYSRILKIADAEDVSLVVVGATGQGQSTGGFGEVASHVVKFATCSVLVVR